MIVRKASHIEVLTDIGCPACSFIITRRLYKTIKRNNTIINRQQESCCFRSSSQAKFIQSTEAYRPATGASYLCWDPYWSRKPLQVFLTLATPISNYTKDYIVQSGRYQILEELGCNDVEDFSGLSLILIQSWTVIFPFISLVFYARK